MGPGEQKTATSEQYDTFTNVRAFSVLFCRPDDGGGNYFSGTRLDSDALAMNSITKQGSLHRILWPQLWFGATLARSVPNPAWTRWGVDPGTPGGFGSGQPIWSAPVGVPAAREADTALGRLPLFLRE